VVFVKKETKYSIIYLCLLSIVIISSYLILELSIENIFVLAFMGFILLYVLIIFFRKNVEYIIKLLILILSITMGYLFIILPSNTIIIYIWLFFYPGNMIDNYSQNNELKRPRLSLIGYIIILIIISMWLFFMINLNEISLNSLLTIISNICLSVILTITVYKLHKQHKK